MTLRKTTSDSSLQKVHQSAGFVSFQGGGNDERSSPGVAGGAVQVFLGYVFLVYVGQVVRSEKLTSWGARGEKFWPGSKGACSESSNPVYYTNP